MQLNQALTACSLVAALAACSNAPSPTTGDFRNQGYLQDTAGNNAVVRSLGYDVCVRTSDWTPARAIEECDPDLVPKPAIKPPVAPPPKVSAPPPAPKVVPPAPPAPVQKFTLSADALFDFDKAMLKPDGMKKLDELANALRGKQYEAILATGHTDRIGSVRYNQRLSERRADAVKKYLASKGLDANTITAVGKGKAQPVTKPGDCRGPKMSRAAIQACLQPDRRVDIEVGSREAISMKTAPATPVAAKPAAKAKAAPGAKAQPKAMAKPAQ